MFGEEQVNSLIPIKDKSKPIDERANEAITYAISNLLDNNSIKDILSDNYDLLEIQLSLQDTVKQEINNINNENNRNEQRGGRAENINGLHSDRRRIPKSGETTP